MKTWILEIFTRTSKGGRVAMFNYEIIESFNDLELIVYKYILSHKNEVKYMTIRELADAVHVSTSTIVRFCKKNGCDGYAEFKAQLKMFLKEENSHSKIKLNDDGIDEIMRFFHMVTSTEYEQLLQKTAEAIANAKQLIFIGIGTSGILGKYGARYFSNLGKFSQYIEDPYYPIGHDMESALVIALSESGETEQVVKQAERFRHHNCKLLSITNKESCTLAKISDFHLTYYISRRLVQDEYNITTQVPVIYLLESLGRRIC